MIEFKVYLEFLNIFKQYELNLDPHGSKTFAWILIQNSEYSKLYTYEVCSVENWMIQFTCKLLIVESGTENKNCCTR